tara:strand:+ start:758 stop:1123 length:366 start_codon:yes stop_codon:yes gene_type:complete
MEYCNNFEYDLKLGQIKEKELGLIFNEKTIEVKTDLQAAETGSVFVEYESRGKPSGIAKSKADYYCFVIGHGSFILIETDKLKKKCRNFINTNLDRKGGDNNTSKGILLPVLQLVLTIDCS